MASIILSTAGAAIGAYVGGPVGAVIGAKLGQMAGTAIDNKLFPTNVKRFGPRLEDLAVQTSTYGKMIPIAYGSIRMGGNVIWMQPIQENASSSTSSAGAGKGGGGKVSETTTSYSYSVTLAIGVCEGPIDEVLRIWADAEQLDLSQYTLRIYNGDETQMPDSLMVAVDGAASTPAYRGLAYVIFENFQLGDYGNRIPNFTFEIKRKFQAPDYNNQILEDMIDSMIMIPGAGEFVYDTQAEYKIPGVSGGSGWLQQGNQQSINLQNATGTADALVSLDQLADTCPNVEWVSVVCAWFGTAIDAGTCTVLPGVEFQTGAITSPDSWAAGSFTRSSAHQITIIGDAPQFGGTPSDASILRYLTELRNRGYKIMFYPMMFMDVSGKPWRGTLTGSASNVASFFTKTNGYNAFITHYASLVNGYIDGFIIGSELKGLTGVASTPGTYPGVSALVSLAATVKSTLGSSVTVTYAADWSEYHHTDGGWYNMDPLWASSNIDVIGIDAYFPLTNVPQDGYDIAATIAGWTSGEGYDFYFSDPARTVQVALTPEFAWKNLAWFWNNHHVNPDSTTTAWTPSSKKIWFTEFGFPSVDGATNEPNVFYDPTTSASAFPYFSKGRVDFRAQRTGLMATEQQWAGSSMVERMFVWTWDARPYPYWPDLTGVWSDGVDWATGHWVQGKLGISSLAAVIANLCERGGLLSTDIDVSAITDQLEGFILSDQQTIRDAIEALQQGYFFDAVESDNILKFAPRGGATVLSIPEDDLIPSQGTGDQMFRATRAQEIDLPKRVNIVYLNRLLNYQSSVQYSQREVTSSLDTLTIGLPIVFADQIAKITADITLFTNWVARNSYQFEVGAKYAQLDPADIISVTVDNVTYTMRITSTRMQPPGIIRIQAVAEDISTYDFYTAPGSVAALTQSNVNVPATQLALLDTPAFPGDSNTAATMRMAANGLSAGWSGAAIYRSDDGGANYNRLNDITSAALMGSASNALGNANACVFDNHNTLTVLLLGGGELQSVSQLAVLNGANAALIGSEIVQFTIATLVSPGQYTLSGFLRGRLGTEWATNTHAIGDNFVTLDGSLAQQIMATNLIGLLRPYKAVTLGNTLSSALEDDFTYTGIALKPYAPVQIKGIRDSSGNLTINWIRRTRLNGDWADNADVPLNEASEAYEIDIMSGGTVKRAITGLSSPTASYTAAQQVIDFGSAQSSVSVNIYQLSAIVGRGYAGTAFL